MRFFKPKQYTFIYCPVCKNELISTSMVFSTNDETYEYICSQCTCASRWNFDVIPGGFLLSHQKPSKKFYKYVRQP